MLHLYWSLVYMLFINLKCSAWSFISLSEYLMEYFVFVFYLVIFTQDFDNWPQFFSINKGSPVFLCLHKFTFYKNRCSQTYIYIVCDHSVAWGADHKPRMCIVLMMVKIVHVHFETMLTLKHKHISYSSQAVLHAVRVVIHSGMYVHNCWGL